jgi:hypothetical protein
MAQLDETAPLTREQTVGVIGRLTAPAASWLRGSSCGIATTYWAMRPDEALRETAANVAIDRSEIRKLKFKTGVGDAASPDDAPSANS